MSEKGDMLPQQNKKHPEMVRNVACAESQHPLDSEIHNGPLRSSNLSRLLAHKTVSNATKVTKG